MVGNKPVPKIISFIVEVLSLLISFRMEIYQLSLSY